MRNPSSSPLFSFFEDAASRPISRRGFILLSAAGVACLRAGGACAAESLQTPSLGFGPDPGERDRVLVAYATRMGSTVGVAEAIGQELCAAGASAEVRPLRGELDPSGYRAVVLGSAIRMGAVLPELTDFLEKRQAELARVPTAVFVVCMTLAEDTTANRAKVRAYLDPVRAKLNPVAEGHFAGRMEYAKLPFFARMMIKYMVRPPEGDFRNWSAIQAWPSTLPSSFTGKPLAAGEY